MNDLSITCLMKHSLNTCIVLVFNLIILQHSFQNSEVPWLIFPGLSLIGGAGITFLMTNMQISVLFPTMGSVVVGIFCGGFDASTGTQLLVKVRLLVSVLYRFTVKLSEPWLLRKGCIFSVSVLSVIEIICRKLISAEVPTRSIYNN